MAVASLSCDEGLPPSSSPQTVESRVYFGRNAELLAPTGVRDTLLLSALVSRRPGARWMRVGVYHHAGSIAPLHTPVGGRGAPFRLRILDFISSRLHLFTTQGYPGYLQWQQAKDGTLTFCVNFMTHHFGRFFPKYQSNPHFFPNPVLTVGQGDLRLHLAQTPKRFDLKKEATAAKSACNPDRLVGVIRMYMRAAHCVLKTSSFDGAV